MRAFVPPPHPRACGRGDGEQNGCTHRVRKNATGPNFPPPPPHPFRGERSWLRSPRQWRGPCLVLINFSAVSSLLSGGPALLRAQQMRL